MHKNAEEGIRVKENERKKFMEISKQKMIIMNQIQSGKMSEEQYMDYMRQQIAKDKKMMAYFIDTKQIQKAETV